MGRAVNAESIMAIVSIATSFGHGYAAMRRVLQAPWVREMRLELGGHRHCRGALARVQPATCSHITLRHLTASTIRYRQSLFERQGRDQMLCIDNLSKVLARLIGI